ncbi:ammonium transport protein AmtB [Candidatus Scalindua japonica]|uniref:Ammonium transporter n=1 Tax=Candidatus Scalindua japonica TaxID=1284222 RepID=A0A286TTB8_9BACT|nr:ammonium transporter [Candidatus Scalindua japonica]GAX59159.1 ammonium transport protein AmtB [Candidatus Scalindua japonica]
MQKIFRIRTGSLGLLMLCVTSMLFLWTSCALAGDPNGAFTFTKSLEGLTTSGNFVWILMAAFLILFMQAGFMLLGGLVRSKNMLSYMTHCFMATTAGAFIFWLFGFALMFGGSHLAPGLVKGNSFIGYGGFLLLGETYDVKTILLFIFMAVVATFIGSIIAGAVAERIKFSAFLISCFLVYAFVYSFYGHWIWGEGWLAELELGVGVKDFAGSGVVHAIGGICAFMGAWALGPRIGKFNPDGSSNHIPGHNIAYVLIGTIILAFGWLAYDAGSTLAISELRSSIIAANTFLAGISGAIIVVLYTYIKNKKADIAEACNGALGGFVAVSASCAYVAPWAAVIIGLSGGLLMCATVWLVEQKFKVDDPLGAVSVHGANGLWGLLAVGIFADGSYAGVSGLITGSGGQFLAQLIAFGTAIVWAGVLGFGIFFGLKHTIGIRVSKTEELDGLDVVLHGTQCYPPDGKYIEDIDTVVRKHIRLGEFVQ